MTSWFIRVGSSLCFSFSSCIFGASADILRIDLFALFWSGQSTPFTTAVRRTMDHAVIADPAVDQVHEIQQRLADDLEPAEVHDLGFVVLEFREAARKASARRKAGNASSRVCPGWSWKPGRPIAPSMPCKVGPSAA